MFEASLVESRGLVVSRTQRWSAVGSAALQLMLAALIVTVPLLRPQTMKMLAVAPRLTVPPPAVRPPEPVRMMAADQASTAPSIPQSVQQVAGGTRHFPSVPGLQTGDEPLGPITNIVMNDASRGVPSFGPASVATAVTVARSVSHGPLNISDLQPGMLLEPIRPVYPAIAKATGTQGTVVIDAIISKAGRIESLHAVSGPAMLRQAALDAVSAARYRPYLLSGSPVEVQTTITVVFTLGN